MTASMSAASRPTNLPPCTSSWRRLDDVIHSSAARRNALGKRGSLASGQPSALASRGTVRGLYLALFFFCGVATDDGEEGETLALSARLTDVGVPGELSRSSVP